MATITEVKNKRGELTGYKFAVAVDYIKTETAPDPEAPDKKKHKYRQVWRTTTVARPEGLTPTKELKAVQRLADEWEEKTREQYELEKRGAAPTDKATLSEFINNVWIPKHVKNGTHTPSTIAFFTYMSNDIKDYFTAKWGNPKVSDIDRLMVLDYLRWMKTEAKTKRGTPYGATTIQHHFSTLRNICEFAKYIGYLKDDPCTSLRAEDRPHRKSYEIDFMSKEEALKFLAALESDKEKAHWNDDANYLYWQTLVNVLIRMGLRRGELAGLQWGDYDKKNLILIIRRNVTIDTSSKGESDPDKKIHIGPTKGKESRILPVPRSVAGLLDKLKESQDKRYGTLLPNAYIFCRSDAPYMPMYPTEPTRLLKKFNKRHGLRDVSPHDLRHTAASLAKAGGADMKDIQALMGHKDVATSQRFYVGITLDTQRNTAEAIDNLLSPETPKAKAE